MDNPVIIFGSGAAGIAAMEAFESNGAIIYGFLDDKVEGHGKEIGHVTVLGAMEDDGFLKLIGKKCDPFVAIESAKERKYITEMILERRKMMPVNCIDKKAFVSAHALLGHGNLFASGTVLHALAKVGNHNQLFANAQVENEAHIGDYCTLSAGALVGNRVVVEDGVFIGSGAVLVEGIKVGKNARIGAGSVVISDVPSGKTYFGNPAVEYKS